MKQNLRSAEYKVIQYDRDEWYGYLTPSEAIAILDDGAKEANSYMYQRACIQQMKDKGDSRPLSFYFYPSEEQKRRWLNKKLLRRHDGRYF